jgi:hypothetical protein
MIFSFAILISFMPFASYADEENDPQAISYIIGAALSTVFDDGVFELETNANYRGDGQMYPMFGFGLIATNPHWYFGLRASINNGIDDIAKGTNSFGGLLLGYIGRNQFIGKYYFDLLIGVEDVPPVGTNQYMISPRINGQIYNLGKVAMPFRKFIDVGINWAASYRFKFGRDLTPNKMHDNSATLHLILTMT